MFSCTCGNFWCAGRHLCVILLLLGWEAFSWERDPLLRGPLNWGKVGEGCWGKSPRASLTI